MAFSPLPETAFDNYKAAHLLWRAGFGGTWEDVQKLQQRGLKGAVDWLVDIAPPKDKPTPPECAQLPEDLDKLHEKLRNSAAPNEKKQLLQQVRKAEHEKIAELKVWWLNRILTTERPLEEKMTLFWHSHFATSFADKVEMTYPMWQQNEMFRRFCLGRFPDQLRQVIRNPAMLVWLDNAQSRAGHPNENFARELMELFSMGVGNYTEKDVKESARALTGFTINRNDWTFSWNPNIHDPGQKTYLGNTGDWSGDDVVQFITENPATSRFMARKYLQHFLWSDPEPDIVEAAAKIYRDEDLALAPFLRRLFMSEEFYSQRAQSAIVKSPVQLTIGALKSMRVPLPDSSVVTEALRLMGQDLFFPPEVNGWVGGMAWINSNMLLVRYNFANFLLNGVSPDQFRVYNSKTAGNTQRRTFVESQRKFDWAPVDQLKADGTDRKLHNAGDVVDYYVKQFLQRPIPNEFRAELISFLETDAAGGRKSFTFEDQSNNERIRGLIHLIMSSPDYQLC